MNTLTQEKNTNTNCSSKNTARCASPAREVKPKYAVSEQKNGFEVRVEVPGAKRESVEIGFEGGVLDVTATRTDSVPETWRPLSSALSQPNYRLRFSVADSINAEGISALVEDGVLALKLPLKEAVKPRSITVN